MQAQLVYDQSGSVRVPEAMGTGRDDQLQGTELEKLVEVAGRCCYDSLGVGRNSTEYHQHINDVNHGSVQEHAVFTLFFPTNVNERLLLAFGFNNHPGVWVYPTPDGVRVTMNVRAAREFLSVQNGFYTNNVVESSPVADTLRARLHELCPLIQGPVAPGTRLINEIVTPEYDHERWITLYMVGGRGFSHELVRHKYATAVSQRSTRYVDETNADWCTHPLIAEYLESDSCTEKGYRLNGETNDLVNSAQSIYAKWVDILMEFGLSKGQDKVTARKQARGAARNYLGNGLQTELIFSASVAQWRRMLDQRGGPAADGEIRAIFRDVYVALMQSQYCTRFMDYQFTADGCVVRK